MITHTHSFNPPSDYWEKYYNYNPLDKWGIGLPWWLSGKKICLQCRRPSFHLWVRKVPWRREWQPTPVFLPGEYHEQRRLACYSPWGCKESDMTEWLTLCSLYRWENWSKERWRNLSRSTGWLWIHTMGFRYHTPKLYTYWPETELIFTVSLRMLKSVFFSLSLPGNLRSPVLACWICQTFSLQPW